MNYIIFILIKLFSESSCPVHGCGLILEETTFAATLTVKTTSDAKPNAPHCKTWSLFVFVFFSFLFSLFNFFPICILKTYRAFSLFCGFVDGMQVHTYTYAHAYCILKLIYLFIPPTPHPQLNGFKKRIKAKCKHRSGHW